MAAAFGLVMDISALWLRVSFVGEDKDNTGVVQKTHDRLIGGVYASDEPDAEFLFELGTHIPKAWELPRLDWDNGTMHFRLAQMLEKQEVKKFFIRKVIGKRLEVWFGKEDVAANADYRKKVAPAELTFGV
jgi:hypothetical protein